MCRTIAIGLTLMLAAFAPPDQPPANLEPTQQQAIPKTWVPETRPDQPPPVTLDAAPRAPSAYRHGTDLACAPRGGPRAAPKEFVNAYQAAMTAFRNDQFADAIRYAELAAAYAKGAREWTAIEQIRIGAFQKLGNDAELVASLQAALAAKNCLPPQQDADYREQLEQARSRLAAPR